MKTIVVPVDFSPTSKNAAFFAAGVTARLKNARMILYNEFDNIVAGSDGSPLADEPEARKKIAETALQNIQAEILAIESSVDITCHAIEEGSFIKSFERFIIGQSVDLVIMGITITSGIEQTLVESNALQLVGKHACPVMIIPPDAKFRGIKNVLFATDFENIEASVPAENVQSVLNIFSPVLHVVNVNNEDVRSKQGYAHERKALEFLLQSCNPVFHFIRDVDFKKAINQFVAEKDIDLILTIPKKHSFLQTLFHASHTKQLIYHVEVPVLAIHEQTNSI